MPWSPMVPSVPQLLYRPARRIVEIARVFDPCRREVIDSLRSANNLIRRADVKLKLSLFLVSVAMMVSVLHSQQLPKSQLPDLGRTTKEGDELPLFNFDEYFTGKWNFEWDVP